MEKSGYFPEVCPENPDSLQTSTNRTYSKRKLDQISFIV